MTALHSGAIYLTACNMQIDYEIYRHVVNVRVAFRVVVTCASHFPLTCSHSIDNNCVSLCVMVKHKTDVFKPRAEILPLYIS